jgi:UbiD family decarboxylase
MNEQLIKFIELCIMDGVVTDKEREVIFRKSKELWVPEDECEIILEGMIQQKGGVNEIKNENLI